MAAEKNALLKSLEEELYTDLYALGSILLYAMVVIAGLIMQRYQFFLRLSIGIAVVYAAYFVLRTVNLELSTRAARAFLLGFFVSDYYNKIGMRLMLIGIAALCCYAIIKLKKERTASVLYGGFLGAVMGSIFVLFNILEQEIN